MFTQINDLRRWEGWSPWKAMDPAMVLTYGARTVGKGGTYSWSGRKAGAGSGTIAQSRLPSQVVVALDFGDSGTGTAQFDLADDGAGGSTVVWTFFGRHEGPLGGWLALITEPMFGPQFERGLAALKAQAEAESQRAGTLGTVAEHVLRAAGQDIADAMRGAGEAAKRASEEAAKAIEGAGR